MAVKFLIFCMGRTGSTQLSNILSEHPEIGSLYFEPFNAEKNQERGMSPATSGGTEKYLSRLYGISVGVKHVWTQADVYTNYKILKCLDYERVIYLTPNDFQRCLLSHYIASETKIYQKGDKSHQEIMAADFKEPDLNYWGQWREKRLIEKDLYFMLLKNLKKPFYPTTYEELFGQFTPMSSKVQTLKDLLKFIMADPTKMDWQKVSEKLDIENKLNSEQTYHKAATLLRPIL